MHAVSQYAPALAVNDQDFLQPLMPGSFEIVMKQVLCLVWIKGVQVQRITDGIMNGIHLLQTSRLHFTALTTALRP